MTIAEIQSVIDMGDLPVAINSFVQLDATTISINNLIPLKVLKVNKSYNYNNIIDLRFSGITQGHLVFSQYKGKIAINSMTEFEFIMFLTEANFEEYSLDEYEFKTDFIVIKETFLNTYRSDYKDTSALWGGFSHSFKFTEPSSSYLSSIHEIEAGSVLIELDNYSYESTIRAIEQPYAFERFLKLYHLLELQFDYFLIEKIKSLQVPGDSNEIGTLLNSYSRIEIERLTDIILSKCSNINALAIQLELIFPFKNLAEDIFFKFGNSKNPFSDKSKFDDVFSQNSFSDSTLSALKVTNNNRPYDVFIPKLVSYWIYRIRCSVAHNKIGEYLLSWDNENFIVDFAEPLLKEVLKQCFKK